MPRSSAIALFLLLSIAAVPSGQQPPPQPPAAPPTNQTFGSGATAVVIDVVVRDDKGRPVTGLRQEDFTLFEDDVQQRVGAFVEVAHPERAAVRGRNQNVSSTAAERLIAEAQNPAATGPRFLAIVFDRLSNEARSIAYKGALASLETLREGDFVGIFLADRSLVTIQAYTNDRARIEAGIHDVATRATTRFDGLGKVEDLRNRDNRGGLKAGDADPSVPVVASAESEGRPVDGRTILEREILTIMNATNNSWELNQRDYQGYATTNALLAVVNGLGVLPGRKSIIFFAEALAIPDAVLPHFRNVVAAANRANVSAYTIDSAGLRAHSGDATIGREVRAMGAAGLAVSSDGGNRSSVAILERNEDVLRKDPRTSLTLLAEQTGGFLVENTNDLANAFRRVDADRRFYYLLTYAPTNATLDSAWRNVVVTVPNRKVTVRARTGYVATAGRATVPLLTYENEGLAALARTPAPADLPVRSAALVFPGGSEALVAVLAATDGTAIEFQRSGDQFRAEFNVVARILDAKGVVVRKASQPYRLTGPLAETDRARAGDILFFRQPTLEPGTYTLEVAVHDALASRVGVRRTAFTVPDRSVGFEVSSLVLVRRAEPVKPEERQPGNPLFVGDVVLYPNLGEKLWASSTLALTCFLSLSGLAGGSPEVKMELLANGATVAQGPLPLPPPDASGRIRYVGELSIGAAAATPGDYMLRLTVTKDGRSVVREATFTVAASDAR
jgi:VWFA-related protein